MLVVAMAFLRKACEKRRLEKSTNMCASNKHAELAAVQTVGRAPFSHAHEHEAAIALLQSDRVALLRKTPAPSEI